MDDPRFEKEDRLLVRIDRVIQAFLKGRIPHTVSDPLLKRLGERFGAAMDERYEKHPETFPATP
jgi:hypothetical protein